MSDTFRKTADMVEALAGYGAPAAEIAMLVGISEDDLATQYAEALTVGPVKARQKVRQALYTMAIGGKNYQATAAWLEQYGDLPVGDVEPEPVPAGKPADVIKFGDLTSLAVARQTRQR